MWERPGLGTWSGGQACLGDNCVGNGETPGLSASLEATGPRGPLPWGGSMAQGWAGLGDLRRNGQQTRLGLLCSWQGAGCGQCTILCLSGSPSGEALPGPGGCPAQSGHAERTLQGTAPGLSAVLSPDSFRVFCSGRDIGQPFWRGSGAGAQLGPTEGRQPSSPRDLLAHLLKGPGGTGTVGPPARAWSSQGSRQGSTVPALWG